jgi:hypothetical protein
MIATLLYGLAGGLAGGFIGHFAFDYAHHRWLVYKHAREYQHWCKQHHIAEGESW